MEEHVLEAAVCPRRGWKRGTERPRCSGQQGIFDEDVGPLFFLALR